MKTIGVCIVIVATLLLSGCQDRKQPANVSSYRPQTECIVKTTPVKNQGNSSFCWAYAMLATIESEHLMQGDSVNLSVDYVARRLLERQATESFLTQGKKQLQSRGMCSDLLDIIQNEGVTHYDAYHGDDVNYRLLERKVQKLVDTSVSQRQDLQHLKTSLHSLLDEEIRPEVRYVFMLGAEYTPLEFAHSVCRLDEYVALTSFSHHPFGKKFVLEVPDNHNRNTFLNLPLDKLQRLIDHSLHSGHPVCWEGDASEPSFSFSEGLARLSNEKTHVTQAMRQREFESFRTTDDHCLELIGIAKNKKGKKYYICKNSWGTNNRFGGLMYMTEAYLRAKTVAVWMKSDLLEP